MKKLRINLGCGYDLKQGYLNVDVIKTTSETVVQDLDKPWKFAKDNTVDELYVSDVIEHLNDLNHFFAEVERVLKVGGIIKINYPHYKNPSAYIMDHKHFFSWKTWDLFPSFFDKAGQSLKVVQNTIVVEDNIFPFTLLNVLANVFPRSWEKLFYVAGGKVVLKKQSDKGESDENEFL